MSSEFGKKNECQSNGKLDNMCPIPKNVDSTNSKNYRGILLPDVTYKVLTRIIRNKLSLLHDTLIGEYRKTTSNFTYADEVALITRSKKETEKLFSFKMKKAARGYELKVDEDKTKYVMKQEETTVDEQYSKFKTETKIYNFETVKHFEKIGVTVSCDNEEELEIDKRISKGSKATGSVNRMLKSREISRTTKIKIYRTVVRPTVVYECEVWERKMVRKIFIGTKTEDGKWRRKTNKEIKDLSIQTQQYSATYKGTKKKVAGTYW
jgi:hypothetical protein